MIERKLSVQEMLYLKDSIIPINSSVNARDLRVFDTDGRIQKRKFENAIYNFIDVWEKTRTEKQTELETLYKDEKEKREKFVNEYNKIKDSNEDKEVIDNVLKELGEVDADYINKIHKGFNDDKALVDMFNEKEVIKLKERTDKFIKTIILSFKTTANDQVFDRICEEWGLFDEKDEEDSDKADECAVNTDIPENSCEKT
jgi:hypothetical protein